MYEGTSREGGDNEEGTRRERGGNEEGTKETRRERGDYEEEGPEGEKAPLSKALKKKVEFSEVSAREK
jgi:hypothetical protein